MDRGASSDGLHERFEHTVTVDAGACDRGRAVGSSAVSRAARCDRALTTREHSARRASVYYDRGLQ